MRYVPELGKWLTWFGTHWQVDAVGAVMEMAKQTAFRIYEEGTQMADSHYRDRIARH
ncbi:MAG: hypothetical protein IPQ15_09615 [Betaproteobacteria bacterium]|nr:hypothetical protein [Betaproteobacteria bacterium]